MNESDLKAVALSVRSLSMDAIQKANSGHPGLPLGCAELAAVLYGEILKHNPKNPAWSDRDRFVLSAGHGSMLLYSILHLAGYGVSLDDIKNFRQVGSKCPGHPEYGVTPGVEMTTGPLGQGLASAAGFAIAETMAAARFNTDDFSIVDHYTYVLSGEGCLMEGVSSEAASLAGHLKLGKLIVFYDENNITIDGSTNCAFTEDVASRYTAYGWQILRGSMYNMADIASLVDIAKTEKNKPTLIILKSVIGNGAPTVAGTSNAHGAPLGVDGVKAAKEFLGLDPSADFQVAPQSYEYFSKRAVDFEKAEQEWNNTFDSWSKKYPEKRAEWDLFQSTSLNGYTAEKAVSGCAKKASLHASTAKMPDFDKSKAIATRAASKESLNKMASVFQNLVGGSADLQGPNAVAIKEASDYSSENRSGRYIRYGIREFAMAAISNGIALHGGFRPFCATFMVFSDYLRPALRLSALMKLPVVYVLTHDSIFVGEDGPTHQPVETLAALRAIPNVLVLRPGDAEETFAAWQLAVSTTDRPVCLILSRQGLPVYEKECDSWQKEIVSQKGAYIVKKGSEKPDVTILATGSEVSLALKAAEISKKNVRVVSVICREQFAGLSDKDRKNLISNAKRVIAVEAGVSTGWERFVSSEPSFDDNLFCINSFGESGKASAVAESLGFTAERLAEKLNLIS